MHSFFSQHAVFLIPIIVSLLTQLIKFFIFGWKHGWKWKYLTTHGHMPSSHTSFAASLATSIGYYEGIDSGAFAVAVGVAFLIIDDALRLRNYLGDQSRAVNLITEQLHLDPGQFPHIKERIGHTKSEVIAGGIVGFFLTILLIRYLG